MSRATKRLAPLSLALSLAAVVACAGDDSGRESASSAGGITTATSSQGTGTDASSTSAGETSGGESTSSSTGDETTGAATTTTTGSTTEPTTSGTTTTTSSTSGTEGSTTDAPTTGDTTGGIVECETDLVGVIRDFHASHPDFEAEIGAEQGIVATQLGGDHKPVYAGGGGTATTHGAANFNQWYNDAPGVNQALDQTIALADNGMGAYVFDSAAFFPIDGQGFGDEGNPHNYHFTLELHTKFKYEGGEVFKFTGDDDLFVFVNGVLAIDLGGVHGPMSGEVDMDAQAAGLGISVGNEYTLDFFFAERHTSESNFHIETTIACFEVIPG
ncbi:MAG: fibro-slime domain-containing protein [Nannocystaceae bacterium]